jgi:hypothetical protein
MLSFTQPKHIEYRAIIRILHTHTLTHTEALLGLSSSYPIRNATLNNAHTDFFFWSFLQAVNRRDEIKEDGAEV